MKNNEENVFFMALMFKGGLLLSLTAFKLWSEKSLFDGGNKQFALGLIASCLSTFCFFISFKLLIKEIRGENQQK